MKISIFNQNSNIYQTKPRNSVSFGSEIDIRMQRYANPGVSDVFQRSDDSKYFDVFIYQQLFAKNGPLGKKTEEILRKNYAIRCYLSTAVENLDLLKKGSINGDWVHQNALTFISPKGREQVEKTLSESEVRTKDDYIRLLETYRETGRRKIQIPHFYDSFVKAVSKLDSPEDYFNFISILTEIEHLSGFSDEYPYDVNEIAEFLKYLGVKNEASFKKTFKYLASRYGNFEDGQDLLKGVIFIREMYPALEQRAYYNAGVAGISDIDVPKIYLKNAPLINYILIEHPNTADERFDIIFPHLILGADIAPHAIKVLQEAKFSDPTELEGKYQLLELLTDECLSVNGLNRLTRAKYIDDLNLTDVITSRNEIIDYISGISSLPREDLDQFYMLYAQTLNAIYNSDMQYMSEPVEQFLKVAAYFELKNDKDFINFYLNVTAPKTKQKGKKQPTRQVLQKDLCDFFDLLSYLDSATIQKYKKDKNYPLYNELKKRRAEFEEAYPKIEAELQKRNAHCMHIDAFEFYMKHYDVFKASPNISALVDKMIEDAKQSYSGFGSFVPALYELTKSFRDEDLAFRFLFKNNIDITRFDDGAYNTSCLEIAHALLDNQDEQQRQKYAQKLIDNHFMTNSKKAIVSFVNSKDKATLQTAMQIILDEDIPSVSKFNKLMQPYFGKNRQLDDFLRHYSATGMGFSDYLSKISQIEKEVNSYGIEIPHINNDNIFSIGQEELQAPKLGMNRTIGLASKLLNPKGEGNFICGLENAFLTSADPHTPRDISKELLASQRGRYGEAFNNIMEKFNLHASDFDIDTPSDEKYQKALEEVLAQEKELTAFINNRQMYQLGSKKPNMTLHATMRLIDRFILDDENADLFSEETSQKIKGILETIYFTQPYKVKNSQAGRKTFEAYYLHDGYEIKAVFDKDGTLVTIAKNEL